MTSQISFSIVIPCYNEEKNIPLILARFKEILKDQNGLELILVDNGSSDNTGSVIDLEIQKQACAFARKVTVINNQGYGLGILTGLKEAHGDLLAWTHADLQTDPSDVLKAYRIYQAEAAQGQKVLVKGRRMNREFSEKIFSWGMETLARSVLRQPFSEINAQPKLFPRVLLEFMTDPPYDFSLDLYLLHIAMKNNFRIIEFPVYFKERLHEEAKGGAGNFRARWNLTRRTLRSILKLRNRP